MWYRNDSVSFWTASIGGFLLFLSLILLLSFTDHPYRDNCHSAIADCENKCSCDTNGLKNVLCPSYVRDVDAGFPSVALTLKAALHLSNGCTNAIVKLHDRCGCQSSSWCCRNYYYYYNGGSAAGAGIVFLIFVPLCMLALFCTFGGETCQRRADVDKGVSSLTQEINEPLKTNGDEPPSNIDGDGSRAWRTSTKAFKL